MEKDVLNEGMEYYDSLPDISIPAVPEEILKPIVEKFKHIKDKEILDYLNEQFENDPNKPYNIR